MDLWRFKLRRRVVVVGVSRNGPVHNLQIAIVILCSSKIGLPKLFIDVTALNDDASHVGGNVCPARTWRAPGTLPFY